MITSLLKRVYALDVELWVDNGRLRYRAQAGSLSDELKQEFIANKAALISRLQQIDAGKAGQWMIFEFGEMYNKRLGVTSDLCIFRNVNDTFTVWRGTWRTDGSEPYKESTIVAYVSFEEALKRANGYYEWSTSNVKRRKAG